MLRDTNPALPRSTRDGWIQTRMKFDAYVKGRIGWHGLSTDDYTETGCHLITGTDFASGEIRWSECHRVPTSIWERDPYIQLREGDVLITKDGTIGKTAVVRDLPGPATLNSGIFLVRPSPRVSPRFIYWVLNSRVFSGFIDFVSTGSTITHLYQDTFVNMPFLRPSFEEQEAIADFVDAETARLDALIDKKRQLTGLLGERETALINEALAASADGRVPLRRIVSEPPQYGASESGELGEDDWPRYIRITDLQIDGTLSHEDVKRLPPNIAHPYHLRDGDLLIARSGATVGKAFRYQAEMGAACFAGYLIRFRIDPQRSLPELVELWTQTPDYWSQITQTAVQATIQNVSAERYLDLTVPAVPRSLQEALVNRLTDGRAVQARLRERLALQIELLEEHRQALITAAVTGELSVPGMAA